MGAIDPAGQRRFTIWAAAFIEPNVIAFPYAFVSPWPGADPSACWHEDKRSFGGVRDSSRAWNYIVVETDPAQNPERVNVSGTGETTVTFKAVAIPFTDHGLAPDPARASITRPNPCVTVVSVDVTSSNPLVPVSPPIHYSYTICFDESRRKINYFGQHTQYPWHELWISGYGNVVADASTNPTGTIPTPADLFLWQVPIEPGDLSY